MLVLFRGPGQKIHIGDDITIAFLGIEGGQAKIGVDAPRNTPVHRDEVYKRIAAEKAAGATKRQS